MITTTIESVATCERCGHTVEVAHRDATTAVLNTAAGVSEPADWTTLTVEAGSEFTASSYRRAICATCTDQFRRWWYRQSKTAQPIASGPESDDPGDVSMPLVDEREIVQ